MIAFLKKWLGIGTGVDFSALLKRGAQIIDVRTKAEFEQGHIQGAINIPLNTLSDHYAMLKKDAPVITCCASGIRSEHAKNSLKANGFTQVINGGGWLRLNRKLGY